MANAERINLTTGRINNFACPDGKAQAFLWDTEVPGLAVRATPATARTGGVRAFVFQGWLNGAALRITIGDAKAWTLGDARTEARRLRTLVDQGIDPRELAREKAAAKAREKAAVEMARLEEERRQKFTLKALCGAYVAYLRARGKTKSANDTRSLFGVHVIEAWPDVASLPASEVTSLQIAAIVRKVREAGKERTAGILRSYITSAYNAARRAPFDSSMSSELIAFGITVNPAEIVPSIPVNRGERTLSVDELKDYIGRLADDGPGQVLRVALYAGGQRIAQLVRAKVSDFDTETATLRLLDRKGKRLAPREHILPLAPAAAAVVKTLVERRGKSDARIFGVGEHAAGVRAAEICAAMAGEPFDLRDLRRTCETMLVGMGVTKEIRAQLLSHGISGVQSAHYDRYEYFNEKRNTLIAWERRLDEITKGIKTSNVIAFAPSAA